MEGAGVTGRVVFFDDRSFDQPFVVVVGIFRVLESNFAVDKVSSRGGKYTGECPVNILGF